MSAGGKTPAMPSSPNAGQRHGQQVHGHKHLGELAITLFFLLSLFIFSSTFRVVLLNAPSLPNASHIKYLHFVFSRSISFPLPFFSLLRHEQGLLGEHAHASVAVDAALPAQSLPCPGFGDRDFRRRAHPKRRARQEVRIC